MRLAAASYESVTVRSAPRIGAVLGNFFSLPVPPPPIDIVASVKTVIASAAAPDAFADAALAAAASCRDFESHQTPDLNKR